MDGTLPGFEKVVVNSSKILTFYLELSKNVTISSHHHIIFLGLTWNKPGFENLGRSWVLVRNNATTQGTQTPPKKRVATQGHRNPPSGGVLKCVPRGFSRVVDVEIISDK